MIGLLIALYPAGWRRRYGEEFRAVLESRPLGPFDVADVALGALDARLAARGHPASPGLDGGPVVLLRIGGIGGVLGGILFFVGIAAASGLGGSGAPFIGLAALGTLGILLALIGLSAFQARRNPRLAWAAFAIPGIGLLISLVGMIEMALVPEGDVPFIGTWDPWAVWVTGLVATLVGSILFAAATVRAGVFSRRAAQALALSAVVSIVVGMSGFDAASSGVAAAVVGLALGAFSLSWVILGASALRRGPIIAAGPTRDGLGA